VTIVRHPEAPAGLEGMNDDDTAVMRGQVSTGTGPRIHPVAQKG